MAEPQRKPAATRIAQLELKDEQRLVKEGYELLDERRIRLAAEIRTQLGRLRHWQRQIGKSQAAARAALVAALGRHGIEELSAYPPLAAPEAELDFARTRVFGLTLLEAHWHAGATHWAQAPINPSAEARNGGRTHRELLEPILMAAVCSLNLRRLLRE